MKIEKINNNTLKIILSIEELSTRNITIKDIESGKKKAQNFFFDIIEESVFADDFLKDNNNLLVEAAVDANDTFIITITKLENLPESIKGNFSKKYNLKNSPSTLYIFNSLESLNNFVKQVIKNSLYVGQNSLYKYNNMYILTFSQKCVKNINFRKTYFVLTEYCTSHLSKIYNICKIKEMSKIVLSKSAIETLASYILE